MLQRQQTPITFTKPIRITAEACAGGIYEQAGPYGEYLDIVLPDDGNSSDTFEKAESKAVTDTVDCLLQKANKTDTDIDLLLAGDLTNQCTACGYGLAKFDIPYMGLYGACSTFALGLLTAGILLESGQIRSAVVTASSHFCTAERQFRFPLEYGAVSSPTAQTTVTGCGAVMLEAVDTPCEGVYLNGGLYGIVNDTGITDASNMGAAMASAAADTLLRYYGKKPYALDNVSLIATGDLGREGLAITKELLEIKKMPTDKITDCGCLIFDLENQDVGCGGSGCGCSAVMTAGYFLTALRRKVLRRVALVGTGAMMNAQSLQQGLSIPSVAHLVDFSYQQKEG